MNRNKFLPIVLIVGIIVLAVIIFWQVLGGKSFLSEPWKGVAGEPIDVALNFYDDWLAARSGESDPFTTGLLNYEQVGKDLREHLATFEGRLGEEGVEDPVLCQMDVPPGLRTIPVYTQDEAAQFIIRSADRSLTGQAVVTLAAQDGLWQITNISCGGAESAPQGEYSFDKSGFLLKQVPEPLNSDYWHLVFQEAGVLGHAVPLFITDDSVCVQKNGDTAACNDDVLKETIPARVMGSMSESGVQVKRIELVDSVSID